MTNQVGAAREGEGERKGRSRGGRSRGGRGPGRGGLNGGGRRARVPLQGPGVSPPRHTLWSRQPARGMAGATRRQRRRGRRRRAGRDGEDAGNRGESGGSWRAVGRGRRVSAGGEGRRSPAEATGRPLVIAGDGILPLESPTLGLPETLQNDSGRPRCQRNTSIVTSQPVTEDQTHDTGAHGAEPRANCVRELCLAAGCARGRIFCPKSPIPLSDGKPAP